MSSKISIRRPRNSGKAIKTPTKSPPSRLSTQGSKPSTRYLELLVKLTRIFLSSQSPQTILDRALVDVIRFLQATSGSIILINPETGCLEIEASVGLSEKSRQLKLLLGEGITGWVAVHGKPARVDDVRTDPRYVTANPKIRSELAVPLERVNRGRSAKANNERNEVIGVLNVDSTQLSAFSSADEELLTTLAGHISNLIQNAWSYEQARRRADQLDELLKLGQSLMDTDTLPDALNLVAQGACDLIGAKSCDVLLLDSTGENLKWSATSLESRSSPKDYLLAVDDTQIGMVVRRKKPVTVHDIQKNDPVPFAKRNQEEKLVSLLAVPLLKGDRVLGALALYTQKPHLFSNDEIQIVSALANHAALAIQRCHLSEKLVSTEEELRQSERLSAIGLLAAEVAHEIRNPLTVIKMLTHNLNRDIPQEDPRRKDFEVLTRKMEQMNDTVEQVLGLARSSEPVFEGLSLNSIVKDLVLLVRHKLAHQNVILKENLMENLPLSPIDRAQIEQALLNIVLNALHAMPKGGNLELVTGVVENRTKRSNVWIEVKDSGIGMTTIQRQKLFQPFLTSRANGTGLGMAIVNKIVKAHGGEISVRSRSSRGTAVRISLKTVDES
jgi:signal transduction histidine kinase